MKFREEDLHESGRPLTKEEFINKIKTNDEFAKRFGNLGKIYGHQWRKWNGEIDQISDLIKQLKENPDSRRLIANAWAVHDLKDMVLPPCHYGFQVYTRELSFEERYKILTGSDKEYDGNAYGKISTLDIMDDRDIPTRAISLLWNQRSCDTFLGIPFNIASYGTLLHLLAKEVNMVPDELIGNLGDTHLYVDHIEQAKEQINRNAYPLPNIELTNICILDGEFDYELINYKSQPAIKAPLLT